MTMHSFHSTLFALVLGTSCSGGAENAGPHSAGNRVDGFERYLGKQRETLVLDPTRVACRPVRPDTLGRLSLQPGSEDFPEPWRLVDLEAESVEAALDRLLAGEAAAFVAPVFLDRVGQPLTLTSDVIVAFQPWVEPVQAEALLQGVFPGAPLDADYGLMPGTYRVRTELRDGREVLARANGLALRPEVRYAEPDFLFTVRLSHVPNDPGFRECWGLHNEGQSFGAVDADMDAPEAWDVTTGDPAIRVMVMDTGIQLDHPDLPIAFGADFTGQGAGGAPVGGCGWHGTAVAGCIGATMDNGVGTTGIAPGCTLVSASVVQITNCSSLAGIIQSTWVVEALAWGLENGVRVTNSSFGASWTTAVVRAAFDSSRDAGMVHVAGAGNSGAVQEFEPAAFDSVLAIAAIQRDGERASFSTLGSHLFLAAPGVDIETTDETGAAGIGPFDTFNQWGTSFSSPNVAGVAALVLSVDQSLSPQEVEGILRDSAVDRGAPGHDIEFGWGLVNAAAAVRLALPESRLAAPVPMEPDAGASGRSSASADGNLVVFESTSGRLLAGGDANGCSDVFVRDLAAGTTERVSVSSAGEEGNAGSFDPSISADGRYVVFTSRASNLVADDTNGRPDVFLRDRLSGTTRRLSMQGEQQVPKGGQDASISSDGRWVLLHGVRIVDSYPRIFLIEVETAEPVMVSVNSGGERANQASRNAALSEDGNRIVFESLATNLAPPDVNEVFDVFLHDRPAGLTTRVSLGLQGAEPDGSSCDPAISPDGRFVAFCSAATNLVLNDTNGYSDVFLHDTTTGKTRRVAGSPGMAQPDGTSRRAVFSGDGRFLAFESAASNLVSGDTNGSFDVFVLDLATNSLRRASETPGGREARRFCTQPAISVSGESVLFSSSDGGLVPFDRNGACDTFLRRFEPAPALLRTSVEQPPFGLEEWP